MKPLPDTEVLKQHLSYCPESGEFRWLVSGRGKGRNGGVAGAKQRGYIRIMLLGTWYYAHRLAWKIYYGEDPAQQLDHIDGDPSNNRIANLRLATQSQNNYNKRVRTTHSTGHRGVSYRSSTGKWIVRICMNSKMYHVGCYDCIEDAIHARAQALKDNGIDEYAR